MLGTSDAWSMGRLSHRPSEPAYYIVDWRILSDKKLATAPCDQKRKSSLKHANIPNYFLFQLNIHVFTLIYDLNWRKTWVLVLGMVTPKNQYFLLLNPVMTHLVMDFKIFP